MTPPQQSCASGGNCFQRRRVGRGIVDLRDHEGKEWNRFGLLTPRVNRWRGTQVRHVLLGPRNAGLRVLRGRVIGTGNWPATVPADIWRGVVDILADPKRRTRRSRARKHLRSGLALCGVCGNVLGSGVNSPGGLIYLCKGCNKVSP